jgi:hypothetical protein
MEEFLQTPGLLNYHGMGAAYIVDPRFFTATTTTTTPPPSPSLSSSYSWVDGPLLSMLQQNKTELIVSAKRRGRGHGGWSKQNPYLEDRYVEFIIDIDPVSLTNRILTVREQIAKEWIHDLTIITTANNQILPSYEQGTKQARDRDIGGGGGTNHDSDSTFNTPATVPVVVFERTLGSILNNQTSFVTGASSPFRKGNLDLLYNLCTQVSIHRLLRSMKEQVMEQEDEEAAAVAANGGNKNPNHPRTTYEWFRDFYSTRVATYFDGDLPYGRADDFVQALLQSSPSVVKLSSSTTSSSSSSSSSVSSSSSNPNSIIGWIDPLALAEQIIELRNVIVQEWKVLMEQVPHDHATGIRLAVLERQMKTWGSGGSGLATGSSSSSSTNGGTFE